jgi:hypothetical protein
MSDHLPIVLRVAWNAPLFSSRQRTPQQQTPRHILLARNHLVGQCNATAAVCDGLNDQCIRNPGDDPNGSL